MYISDRVRSVCKFIALIAILAMVPLSIKVMEDRENRQLEKENQGKSASEYYNEINTVCIDGEEYRQKKDITAYLVIGIDKDGPQEASNSYNNDQQADFFGLLVMDDAQQCYTLLHLNRDTMTDIQVLGLTGQVANTSVGQLALAHTYGDGLTLSCTNTVKAVSDMLYGLHISGYLSMTMDAVALVNDYVGGVTLTIPEDLTELDPSFTKGAVVTLDGEQALSFVRARQGVTDGTNLKRMERQKLYMTAFQEKIRGKTIGQDFLEHLFDKLSPYICTNCADALVNLLDCYADYTNNGVISPAGEAVMGKEFMEFYVDEADLKRICTELLYTKVDQ